MLAEKYNLRKIIIWLICAVLVIFVIFKVYEYLTTGKIVVTTDNPHNYLMINKVDKGGSTPLSKQSQGNISLRVKPGKYNIVAYSKDVTQGSGRTVSVKARQTARININPPESLVPNPVYGSGTTGVIASEKVLYFIDALTNKLTRVDASGISYPFPDYDLANVIWVKPGLGVAQDKRNDLYVISNNRIRKLVMPFKRRVGDPVVYSISRDGVLYVSNGSDVYSGRMDNNFTKIYSDGSGGLGLSAGIGKVAVVKNSDKHSVGVLVIVDTSGNVIKKNLAASQATWSPDGKYLLVSGEGSNYILNESLKVVGSVPVSDIGVSDWYDDKKIYYGNDSQLWVYDISESRSDQITSLATGINLTAIYTAFDNSYIYFSGANSEKTQLFRVKLDGSQAAEEKINALSVFLPEEIGVCSLNYLIFNKPTIIIKYPSSGTLPENCVKAAKAKLGYYELNPNEFRYFTKPYVVNYHAPSE